MDNKKIELINKAIKNDTASLVQLIKEEQNNIYTTLYYLKKDSNDINDIVQNVLIKLTKKISQLKNPNNFKAWLNQIIINTYYDYLRKNKKNKIKENFINDDEKSMLEVPDYSSNPQEEILNSELDYIIKSTIENLPMHYKIPIALREIQGLSYDEISQVTKTSIGTVKSRIARARTMIKDKITKYSEG